MLGMVGTVWRNPPRTKAARSAPRQTGITRGSSPPRQAWILEPSATGLCKPDLYVFAKLFEDCLKRGLEAQAFSGREIGGHDDVLDFLVGRFVDVDLTGQPASYSAVGVFDPRPFATRHRRRKTKWSWRAWFAARRAGRRRYHCRK